MSWLSRLFSRKPCDHTRHYKSKRWLAPCGTPMAEFSCFDCGFTDVGHVHGDAEGWTPLVVIMRDGVEAFRFEKLA